MVPARMGSQRLKQKNLMPLRGVPLIAHAIRKCREAGVFDDVFVNSEHEDFARIAAQEGVKFHKRPDELANNVATSEQFVAEFLEAHPCDYVFQVHSIAPLLTVKDLKAFVAEIEAGAVPRPDLAVYVEPTQLNVYAAQMGFLICDIAIAGRSAYFGVPELGLDALKAGHAVLAALWAHSAALETLAPHPLVGRPFLLVTEVQAGGYIAVPGECRISLILKLIPGQSLDEGKAALEAAVRAAPVEAGIEIAFAYPAGRDHALGGTPTETDVAGPLVTKLTQAVRSVRPDRGLVEGAPYWSEAPFFATRLGVPTVYCAPGDIRNCHTLEERVELKEYFDGIVAFAAFLADLAEDTGGAS